MTQSGQGEEPQPHAARPAHEGVVLPADGSAPLLPGAAGDRAVPTGGQPWGQPWGPQSDSAAAAPAPAPGQGQEWGGAPGYGQATSAGQDVWDTAPAAQRPEQPTGSGYAPGPYDAHQGQQSYGQEQQYGQQPQYQVPHQPQQYGQQEGGPQQYGQQPHPPQQYGQPQQPQQYGQPQQPQQYGQQYGGGQAWGQEPQSDRPPAQPSGQGAFQGGAAGAQPPGGTRGGGVPMPPAGGQIVPLSAAQEGESRHGGGAGSEDHQSQGSPQLPYPPQSPELTSSASSASSASEPSSPQAPQGPAPYAGAPGSPGPMPAAGAPLPPPADADATQYIAPVPPAPDGATQYIPPVAQPPQAPGAMPPESPAESTTFLGRATPPPAAAPSGGDADATQHIPTIPAQPGTAPYGIRPGAPGDRQPPAEFDNLFRTESDAESPGATQQMPRFDPQANSRPPQGPGPHAQHPQAPAGGRAAARKAAAPSSGRTGSKVPVIAAVVVGCAVLGLGGGALLSGGGDEEKDDKAPVSATGPAKEEKPSPSVDPGKAQAVQLDKLLADSNNSRSAVIRSVANIERCTELPKAATDLRNAAGQRNGLVKRLADLDVDQLQGHAELTTALNKAWKASASADNHYAAWADQAAAKKGCHKGRAKATGQRAAGNRASGTATTAKQDAAGRWNTIADQYGLTKRDKSQL